MSPKNPTNRRINEGAPTISNGGLPRAKGAWTVVTLIVWDTLEILNAG